MRRSALILVLPVLALAGCVGAPEHCHGCLEALFDGGPLDVGTSDLAPGSGGRIAGTGGGIGGMTATGGNGTGGTGSGGRGTGGSNTGGTGTGGRGSGGTGTGGAATGGRGTGGAGTGGMGTGGAGTGGAGTGGATVQGLVLRYAFDENAGTVAADSSGFAGGPRNGTLTPAGVGTATFATTPPLQVGTHYLNLAGTTAVDGGYVVAPNLSVLQTIAPADITIAAWVYVATDTAFQRVFDFGITPAAGNPTIYMYLTTHQAAVAPNSVRFTITTTGNSAQQQLLQNTALLPTNSWHHLAVVLPAGATYTGTLYIDGVSAATNTAMTLHPSNLNGLGTPFGYIGKSGFADPYFAGRIDDFRIYNRALTAPEISALFAFR